MEFLSFDLELATELIPDAPVDFTTMIPSVGAYTTLPNKDAVVFYYDEPYMSKDTSRKLVEDMLACWKAGYTIFGHNTLSFDFQVLANYSGMFEECGTLALNSVDSMFIVVCHKGYFLGLDKLLVGAGLDTKTHIVQLNSGETISDMHGSKAVSMWMSKEFSAVKTYLAGDVIQPLLLAKHLEENKVMNWTSNSGKSMSLKTPLLTVKECLRISLPNTSWMTDPKPREDFYSWIPKHIINKEMAL